MNLDRRNFLKISGAGVAGSVIATNLSAQTSVNPATVAPKGKIITRKLGNTGLEIPIVSLGVMRVDSEAIIKRAIEAGITHFDTAHSYQGGKSEELLGQIIKGYKRESVIIATKINSKNKESLVQDLSDQFNESLQRLQMDYVDILYLHGVNKPEDMLDEKVLNLFKEFKKQGKAKFIGVSTHSNMAAVIRAAIESKTWEVVLTTANFRMKEMDDTLKAYEEAKAAGIGLIAMKTMAGGFWDKGKTQKINTSAALKWTLNNPNITTSIPGCTSFEQLEQNITLLANIDLSEQEKKDLIPPEQTSAGLFCTGCEECLPQCPNYVPIPDMMRAYMYAYGYSDPRMAREVIENLSDAKAACVSCAECKVNCSVGFNIQEKAIDIVRIQTVPKEFLV